MNEKFELREKAGRRISEISRLAHAIHSRFPTSRASSTFPQEQSRRRDGLRHPAIFRDDRSTYRTRRAELCAMGRIRNSGRTRLQAGSKRTVWNIVIDDSRAETAALDENTYGEGLAIF